MSNGIDAKIEYNIPVNVTLIEVDPSSFVAVHIHTWTWRFINTACPLPVNPFMFSGMLPAMRVHVTCGLGIPSAEHVMLSDVLYSLSSISAMIGATADEMHIEQLWIINTFTTK